jgi:DNA-binding SARP family transcriptional activator/Tfp pilus assembly protein PilF
MRRTVNPTNGDTTSVSKPFIEIYTFGALQVVREGQVVTESDWHTRQARQLLKILITERSRPVATDRLIEILWPQSTPAAAATTLRSAINALRNVLEPTRPNRAPSRYVVTENPGYAFYRHPDIWLDVDCFEQNLREAEVEQDVLARLRGWETAVNLYQDDYLISDPYADWAQNERERLRERYFAALYQLAEIQAGLGNYSPAIAACRRILARDEVRENAYQQLMRYQAESGDSASALLTYERCRSILAEELGADPSPLTQQWHQRILNGEVTLPTLSTAAITAPTSVIASPPAAIHPPISVPASLPQQTLLPISDVYFADLFVGREGESSQLATWLRNGLAGRGNLVLIEGEAGVGKTRLVYEQLQQVVATGATVISTACQPLEHQLPFAPLADSVGRYLHSLPAEILPHLPAASLTQLTQIIPSLHDRWPHLPSLLPEPTTSSDENRQRLIEGIVAFFSALAHARPMVLFLDDLHWADADTLTVLNRLVQRLYELPLVILLAYRSDDMGENPALATLLHRLKRPQRHHLLALQRLNKQQVQDFVQRATQQQSREVTELAASLYTTTGGNVLFVTEALRDWLERFLAGEMATSVNGRSNPMPFDAPTKRLSPPTQRVQEIIVERISRLPEAAQTILQLSAVIARDFSLELLERAAPIDPMPALDTLLQRKFLVERPDERLEFSHQVVRQVAYDHITTLARRRYHQRVADALVDLGRGNQTPGEIAFHYGQASASAQPAFAHYSVLAGEMLLRTYGFRQAVGAFDQALTILEKTPEDTNQMIGRALQGRGLAYEGLFDPEGVNDTYRRLQRWAQRWGDAQSVWTAYSRLTSMLGLLGQQRESNELLRQTIEILASPPGSSAGETVTALVMRDLYERRSLIYSPDTADAQDQWEPYTPPPPVVGDPVGDVLQSMERVHAVLPLLDYGWTLLVQGQFQEASRCLEMVVELAQATAQPSLASTAYYQLAVAARLMGRLEESHRLNEQSIAINRSMQGTAAELSSLWPRIGSAFLLLKQGRWPDAERRLRRVVDFLEQRKAFRNHRNSATIGLGLVALAHGDLSTAQTLLQTALADSVNLYPYTHVQAMLGLARIAQQQADHAISAKLLRQALRFAGRRSLLEEYVDSLLTIGELQPIDAPVVNLLQQTIGYVNLLGLNSLRELLEEQTHR